MPAPRNTGLTKRQKERNRQEKQQQKAQKKAERKTERVDVVPGEDPDLAGIVPGPQPHPWDDSVAPAGTDKPRDR
jgi:hypothetical protein